MRNPALFGTVRCLAVLALLLPAALRSQAAPPPAPLPAPTNLDFEQGQPGEVPPGWFNASFAKANGYTAKIVTDKPASGRQAVEVTLEGERKDPRAFGNFMTFFDATPYRGKRVRFRAAVRAEVAGRDTAALWLRVDREGGARGFFDNMDDRPIISPEWKTYEITGEVAPDAKVIFIGMMLLHQGKAWIDAASFEVVGVAETRHEPARPLAGRELENLTAFTRLFGDVRYFHPSDQAAAADWEALALAGVQAAEPAKSPEELARSLEGFFRPLAPTLRVYPTAGPRPPLPPELKPPATGGLDVISWEHEGVKMAGKRPNVYRSERVTQGDRVPTGAETSQIFEAAPYRGKRVVLRGAARAEVPGDHPAVLRLKAVAKDETTALAKEERPVSANEWRMYEVSEQVPADAVALEIDLGLAGGGRVWWDDLSLQVEGEGKPAAELIENADFENPGYDGSPAGWHMERSALRAGYGATLSADHPRSGRTSLLLAFAKPADSPRPDEPLAVDLGGGVSALIPLALYKDGAGTLPHVSAPAAAGKAGEAIPSGGDRATRLADVVLAWNVFQHFYPYFDVVQADWPGELRRSLAAAAADADERAFLKTLRRLVAALHDGHGNVYLSSQAATAGLPVLFDWVEDQLVIAQVAAADAGGLKPGDVVVSLDGRPAKEALADTESLVSGATEQWRRWVALQRMVAGPKDEPVKVETRHPGGELFTADLKRSLILSPESFPSTRPPKISEVKPGIFYVNIDQINDDDFKGALDRLAGAKGIVFDLRGYPGNLSTIVIAHLIDKPVSSARWNVPIVTRPDRQDWKWETSSWSVRPEAPRLKAKVAFITDGRAISYAETYMGIVENYHLAEIVGGPTAGTNGNVNPFTLPGGYNVVWTGMQVLKHDGSRHHGVGIQPTVPAARTLKGVAEGRDELLEKAIAVVGQ